MVTWGTRLLLMAVSALVALLLVEGVMRVFVPAPSPLAFDLFYRGADGQLRLRPLSYRQHSHPEWNVAVNINREGFRDSDAPPAPGKPVILSLGDSFAFGWGVEYPEVFSTRLEAALGGPAEARVLKAAVPGTGTTDHLALLRELLPKHPRVGTVLLGFYVGNDFTDVTEGGAAQFDVVDGLLVRRGEGGKSPGAVAAAKGWLKRKSEVAQLAARWQWERERRQAVNVDVRDRPHGGLAGRDHWLQQYTQVHLREPFPPKLQQGVHATLTALGEMQRLARERGARFLLVVIPRSIQVHEIDKQRYAEAFAVAPDEWDMDRPQRILADWARQQGAESLDVLPALRDAASSGSERMYYFPDSHLTAAGHRVIAEQLRHYLARRPQ